jgi:hypothetical protein
VWKWVCERTDTVATAAYGEKAKAAVCGPSSADVVKGQFRLVMIVVQKESRRNGGGRLADSGMFGGSLITRGARCEKGLEERQTLAEAGQRVEEMKCVTTRTGVPNSPGQARLGPHFRGGSNASQAKPRPVLEW